MANRRGAVAFVNTTTIPTIRPDLACSLAIASSRRKLEYTDPRRTLLYFYLASRDPQTLDHRNNWLASWNSGSSAPSSLRTNNVYFLSELVWHFGRAE